MDPETRVAVRRTAAELRSALTSALTRAEQAEAERDEALREVFDTETHRVATEAALATERAAREEAEQLAVWAGTNLVWFDPDACSFIDQPDATDADVLDGLRQAKAAAALREAKEMSGG